MAWGDVKKELLSFDQFHIFDLSKITNTLNLQQFFTNHWNETHPHTSECLVRHQTSVAEPDSDDILICLVNSDDLDAEFNSFDITMLIAILVFVLMKFVHTKQQIQFGLYKKLFNLYFTKH
jgi:hypothetical protein